MQKITGEKNNREKMPVERIPKPKKKKRKPGPENQKIEKTNDQHLTQKQKKAKKEYLSEITKHPEEAKASKK